MSIAILNEIKSTEEEADQIEAKAQIKARDIVASAKKDAAAMLDKAIKQAELDAKNIIKAYEEKAARDMAEMKSQIIIQCNTIKENSDTKLEDAANLIAGRIVDHSGR